MLVLDEPINGLDPEGIKEMREIFVRMREEKGIAILISSHILEELSKVADRYGIIHEGVLLSEISKEDLLAQCKPTLYMKTSDIEKSKTVLSQMGISNYTVSGDHLEIRERTEEGGAISMAFAKQDIQTLEMRLEGQSLEDFYFRLTGGAKNA